MTRDAEMSTGDFLTLVLRGLSAESDIGVSQQMLAQVQSAIDLYAAPEHQAPYRDRLADAHDRELLASADARLATPSSCSPARFATAARTADARSQLVAGLLEGAAPEGLVVDTDLRWALLQPPRRARREGRRRTSTPSWLRDDTATGRRHAALAHAAVPTDGREGGGVDRRHRPTTSCRTRC